MNSRNFQFAILILAVCLTQFATDIYAPCLSSIALDLECPLNYAQWSMSIYMLAVAASQLIYGPLSEGLGRKSPMIIGLGIMIIGSIVCLISDNIIMLIIGRRLQGCGAGACASLWRPIFRDNFTGEELAKYTSYLVVFITFIVPSAPLLGGYLQEYFGWQANFIFMVFYSSIALISIILGFDETNKNHHISKLNLEYILESYLLLVKSPIFMRITYCTFLSYGAFFSWFVVGPILLIDKIGMSPSKFGLLNFCCGGSAYILTGYCNGKFVKNLGIPFMMRLGWGIMIISGLIMAAGYFVVGINIWAIMVPFTLFYFGSTFIWPNAFAIAFTPFGDIAGYAGALYGFMQICGAAIISWLISYLPVDNQLSFALVIIIASVSSWRIYQSID